MIIEIEGGYHSSSAQIEKDIKRTEILEYNGLNIIKFKNEEIENNIEAVLIHIKDFIESLS